MKKFLRFGLLLFSAAALACAGGCSDDKDDNGGGGSELPDPEGTVLTSMRYTTSQYVDRTEDGAWSSSAYTYFIEFPINIVGFTDIRLTSSGTMKGGKYVGDGYGYKYNRDENTSNGTKFATIGKVKGLAAVKKIPESGWAEEVGALPGYGYVAEYNGVYCRIYVTDYMLDNDGKRIGAILKYQAPFVPEQ